MSKNQAYHAHFTSTYRADCINCENYVGPIRNLESDADDDAITHKKIPGKELHDVKIEITQSYNK